MPIVSGGAAGACADADQLDVQISRRGWLTLNGTNPNKSFKSVTKVGSLNGHRPSWGHFQSQNGLKSLESRCQNDNNRMNGF